MHFDNGNMYITRSETLLSTRCRLGGRSGVSVISPLEGLQIDTPDDFRILEAVFSGEIANLTGVRDV